MPTYDYYCDTCNYFNEYQHSMLELPKIECPRCGHILQKAISGFNIGSGKLSIDMERYAEKAIKRAEMQRDLKVNFGIEELKMIKNVENKNFEDAYNDIKNNSTMVREHMAATKECQRAKLREKQQKRKLSPEEIIKRKQIIIEKRKEQKYEQNKIVTTSQ